MKHTCHGMPMSMGYKILRTTEPWNSNICDIPPGVSFLSHLAIKSSTSNIPQSYLFILFFPPCLNCHFYMLKVPILQISPPEPAHFLNALQALQAQYFLQAFAAVAPSFAQNENYLQLLRQVAACTKHPDPVTQSIGIPLAPSSGPPGFNSVPSSVNALASQSVLCSSYSNTPSTFATTSAKKSKVNAIPPPVMASDFFSPPAEPGFSPAAKSHDISSEDRDPEE